MSRFVTLFCISAFLCVSGFASASVADTSSVKTPRQKDTLAVNLDSLFNQHIQMQKDDTSKVFDRGFDVGRYVSVRRARAVDITPFKSKSFFDNTFVSLRAVSLSIANADYSVGMQGGVSLGKWLHQDHAVRLNFDMGQWNDNFDSSPIIGTELSASYIFNLTSYAFGYRTSRFCEVAVSGGMGYANSYLVGTRNGAIVHKSGNAFTCHAGALINLRVFKSVDFFLEPQVVLYSNAMAVSDAGNWRSWLTAFRGSFGLKYDIRESYSGDSPHLIDKKDGYFISFAGGPGYQNSKAVYEVVGVGRGLGVHVALGVGKYYTDYFAIRYSASYSRDSWAKYYGKKYPGNYFAVRAEGMLDGVALVRHCIAGGKPRERSFFAASVLFGPEMGYMYKVDKDKILQGFYIGMTGGLQAKFRLAPRLSLFLEPRFSMVWYDAPSNTATTLNDHRNYYDGLLNFNAGIEFML